MAVRKSEFGKESAAKTITFKRIFFKYLNCALPCFELWGKWSDRQQSAGQQRPYLVRSGIPGICAVETEGGLRSLNRICSTDVESLFDMLGLGSGMLIF